MIPTRHSSNQHPPRHVAQPVPSVLPRWTAFFQPHNTMHLSSRLAQYLNGILLHYKTKSQLQQELPAQCSTVTRDPVPVQKRNSAGPFFLLLPPLLAHSFQPNGKERTQAKDSNACAGLEEIFQYNFTHIVHYIVLQEDGRSVGRDLGPACCFLICCRSWYLER